MNKSKQRSWICIKQNAHVDEAYLAEGYVSKYVPLDVDTKTASVLLKMFPYLTIVMED